MCDDEKHLLESAQKGELQAFEKLVERYQKKVYNIALRMTGNAEDAYEVSQEAFIRIYSSIRQFRKDSSFSTWLYRITINVCLDELRKQKKNKLVYLDENIEMDDGEIKKQLADKGPAPDEMAEQDEMKRAIRAAINELSEEHRIVVIMRDIQGFSYDDISKILKCPKGTVKSRINRARKILRDILKGKKELFNKDYVK